MLRLELSATVTDDQPVSTGILSVTRKFLFWKSAQWFLSWENPTVVLQILTAFSLLLASLELKGHLKSKLEERINLGLQLRQPEWRGKLLPKAEDDCTVMNGVTWCQKPCVRKVGPVPWLLPSVSTIQSIQASFLELKVLFIHSMWNSARKNKTELSKYTELFRIEIIVAYTTSLHKNGSHSSVCKA